MRTALTSTAAGLAVMAIGVVSLIAMFGGSLSEAPASDLVADLPAPTPTTTAPAVTTSGEPIVVTAPAPTPDLAGVGDAVTRVLYGNGYSISTNPDELEGVLPPAVLQLLIEREVTLTIATDSEEVSP